MEENQLYRSIRKNDIKAFEVVFDRYYQKLCYFSMQYSLNRENAEEIVSDILLKLWQNRNKTEIDHLVPYLYKSVKNASLNRKKQKRTEVWLDEIHGMVEEDNRELKLFSGERLRLAQKIIQEMPPKRRMIFILNRLDGLKYKEIAEVLNISVHTVQNQMVKAVKHLYNQFPDEKVK